MIDCGDTICGPCEKDLEDMVMMASKPSSRMFGEGYGQGCEEKIDCGANTEA